MPYISQLSSIAALLLMGMAGCMTADQSRMVRGPAGSGQANVPADRKVPGSLDKVCEQTKAVLSELNIVNFSVREGAGIRFDCRTASNARFCLVLVDATPKNHEPQIRVHVGWEHDREPEDGLTDPVVGDILNRIAARADEERRRAAAG